ncbi:MAG TPA: hypothetical protein VGQ91_11160 [Ideonella sp.]|nr:hypothetical protein [Ideonella sp.]
MTLPPPAPPDSAPQALPDEVAAFIQSGLSITVGGRDDRLIPSIAKGVGCRVDDQGRQVTVLVFAEAAEAVMRDIAHNRQVSVVFTRPSTNRTVQLKGHDALPVPAGPAEAALVRRHLALLADDLRLLGWDAHYVNTLFLHDWSQLMAIRFAPHGAFAQTPGPGAGQRMALQPAGKP